MWSRGGRRGCVVCQSCHQLCPAPSGGKGEAKQAPVGPARAREQANRPGDERGGGQRGGPDFEEWVVRR
eukprot:gene24403-biopygen10013